MVAPLLFALLGIFIWSFTEYALHNWGAHVAKGRNAFSREHLRHHAQRGYFSPNIVKVQVAVALGVVVLPPACLLLGWACGIALTVGFLSAYGAYELTHRRFHTHGPSGPYGRMMRKHHYYHHFSGPKYNHGVTSPIWDVVFRTYKPIEAPIRVPARHAMTWLVDDEGRVHERYREDYVVVGRDKRRAAA